MQIQIVKKKNGGWGQHRGGGEVLKIACTRSMVYQSLNMDRRKSYGFFLITDEKFKQKKSYDVIVLYGVTHKRLAKKTEHYNNYFT